MKQHHVRPDGMPPVNGYSHVVVVDGRTVVIAGQVPLDGEGALVGAGDVTAQLEQIFANLQSALQAAGARMEDLVKLTVYLTDLTDLPAFRRVRDRHIALDNPPASTVIQVNGLINPAFKVEIDAIAAV